MCLRKAVRPNDTLSTTLFYRIEFVAAIMYHFRKKNKKKEKGKNNELSDSVCDSDVACHAGVAAIPARRYRGVCIFGATVYRSLCGRQLPRLADLVDRAVIFGGGHNAANDAHAAKRKKTIGSRE